MNKPILLALPDRKSAPATDRRPIESHREFNTLLNGRKKAEISNFIESPVVCPLNKYYRGCWLIDRKLEWNLLWFRFYYAVATFATASLLKEEQSILSIFESDRRNTSRNYIIHLHRSINFYMKTFM